MLRWRALTDAPLVAIAIASLPLLLLEFKRSELTRVDFQVLDWINLFVLFAFALDYLVELILCRKRSKYIRHEWTSALIAISSAVALMPALTAFGVLRALRAIGATTRLLAIVKLASTEGREVVKKHAAGFAIMLATLTWLISAVLFTLFEDVGKTGRIHSFGDALWWSLGAITTAGSGDVYPITAGGRIAAGFTMIVGITTLAIVTAKFAQFLLKSDRFS